MSLSQISSRAQGQVWVSIPFAKFSHDTGPYGSRAGRWMHVTRDDLQFTVQDVRIQDEFGNYEYQTMMKITAGADLLEAQDLRELARYALNFDPSSGADLPVQTVMKSPLLAMRYPKSINTVRRVQFKFKNELDFTRAVDILADLQVPITDSRPDTAVNSRPSASHAMSSSSAYNSSSARISLPPPASINQPPIGRSSQAPPQQSYLSTNDTFKVPVRPDTASSEDYRPRSVSSVFTRPHSASSISSAPLFISRTSALDPTHELIKRSSSSSNFHLPRGQHETMDQQHITTQAFPLRGDTLILSSSELQSQMQSQYKRLSAVDQGAALEAPARLINASPFFSLQNGAMPLTRSMSGLSLPLEQIHVDNRESREFLSDFSQRPASTPLNIRDYQSQRVPPKRILPFPKPREPARPRLSSVLDPSPLSKPTVVNPVASTTTADKPASTTLSTPKTKPVRRPAQRNCAVIKSVDTAADKHSPPEAVLLPSRTLREEPSPLAAKSAAASRPSSALSRLQSKAIIPPKRAAPSAPMLPPSTFKRPRMVDQSTQTSGNDSSTIRSIQVNESVETSTASPARPGSPPQAVLSDLEFFVTKYKARPISKELWERPRFYELNEEERQTIINDFICETLENEDFLILCRDTEKTWRRIGLGE